MGCRPGTTKIAGTRFVIGGQGLAARRPDRQTAAGKPRAAPRAGPRRSGRGRPRAGLAVQPDRGAGGLEGRHALGQQARPTKPASTSPEPAVASQGGAFSVIAARPSGAATTVSAPLSSTTAPDAAAARALLEFRSTSDLRPDPLNNRANSPSCGVSTVGAAARALIAREQRLGRLGKARQRVGIEHDGALARERGQHQLAHRCADPAAGPEHDRVEPASARNSASSAAPSTGRTMTARLAAALTASASRGLAIVTSPAPARSAPRAASRAAPVDDDAARHHHRVAAAIFVAVERGTGKCSPTAPGR